MPKRYFRNEVKGIQQTTERKNCKRKQEQEQKPLKLKFVLFHPQVKQLRNLGQKEKTAVLLLVPY